MITRMFRSIVCRDTVPLEVATALQAILWGSWLMLPHNTFSASTAYTAMSSLAPEELWGIFLVLVGIIQVFSIVLRGIHFRGIVSTGSLFVWGFIDVNFWMSGSTSGAPVTYLVYVVLAAWSVVSLSYKDRSRCGN